jgi:hypothetical protein
VRPAAVVLHLRPDFGRQLAAGSGANSDLPVLRSLPTAYDPDRSAATSEEFLALKTATERGALEAAPSPLTDSHLGYVGTMMLAYSTLSKTPALAAIMSQAKSRFSHMLSHWEQTMPPGLRLLYISSKKAGE